MRDHEPHPPGSRHCIVCGTHLEMCPCGEVRCFTCLPVGYLECDSDLTLGSRKPAGRHGDEMDEDRARKGHALYEEGYESPVTIAAERVYQRIQKRRQRAEQRRRRDT